MLSCYVLSEYNFPLESGPLPDPAHVGHCAILKKISYSPALDLSFSCLPVQSLRYKKRLSHNSSSQLFKALSKHKRTIAQVLLSLWLSDVNRAV